MCPPPAFRTHRSSTCVICVYVWICVYLCLRVHTDEIPDPGASGMEITFPKCLSGITYQPPQTLPMPFGLSPSNPSIWLVYHFPYKKIEPRGYVRAGSGLQVVLLPRPLTLNLCSWFSVLQGFKGNWAVRDSGLWGVPGPHSLEM